MKYDLEKLWNDLPVGKENAATYFALTRRWGMSERKVRNMLHDLSLYDNGDNYILIRSGSGKGFYRTDEEEEIKAYKRECLSKGRSIFAPVKKINRVLMAEGSQISFENNMRAMREAAGLKQSEVCKLMNDGGFSSIDKPMLSKMENGVCLPTFPQLSFLASLYGCGASELINVDFHWQD